jgi:hypothetical protein
VTTYFKAHAPRAFLQIFHPKPVHHPLNSPHGAQQVKTAFATVLSEQ